MLGFARRPSFGHDFNEHRASACSIERIESRVLLSATNITVLNPSFEQQATTIDPAVVKVTNWNLNGAVANAFNPDDAAYTNATDTSSTHGVLASPAKGRQHLFINGAGIASQTLTATLQPNKVYHLAAAIGNRGDQIMENYRISLYAGNTRIVTGTGDGESGANFSFRDVSFASASFGASSPLIGQTLRIELQNLNNKPAAGSLQVDFDNIRVTAADVSKTVAIPITNSSFETEQATIDKAVVALTGWNKNGAVADNFNPNDLAYINAKDTGPTGGVLAGPASGRQHLFINGAGTVSQTLADVLLSGQSYKLTVAVGNRSDQVMETYRISLFAGTTQIAATTGDAETITTGTFADRSATSAAFASSSSLIGQKLTVKLINLDTKPGTALQVDFDNVRLTRTPV